MQIDCYGFEASSQWFRCKDLEVYLIKEVKGILCLCYGNQPMRPIHRIDRDEHGCTRELNIALGVLSGVFCMVARAAVIDGLADINGKLAF